MLTDIEIANSAKPYKISRIAKSLGLSADTVIPYGINKAKIEFSKIKKKQHQGQLILVTALTPTPAGEGKSTVSIGLADAFHKLKKKVILSLREPSLGPCFGIKGGATGGGYSQIIPMDEINLNFTGDIHAITAANNLLSAMIDNHIKHGNQLNIKKVLFKRCLDLNDRVLREVEVGLGGKINGPRRRDGFNISVASEIMAILCLSKDLADLKRRLGEIIIAKDINDQPLRAKDIRATGAMAAILREAIKPNLVQTLEHTPALVHGGPFANIAHGTSSIIAARLGLDIADYVITEAGFGADLGAEKFFDIFMRQSGISPDAVVIVATIRALKMHGKVGLKDLAKEDLSAIKRGFANLACHIKNIKKFGIKPIVAINRFNTDSLKELALVKELCQKEGVRAELAEGWAKGSKGCIDLAKCTLEALAGAKKQATTIYDTKDSITDKIRKVAQKIYQAKDIRISNKAKEEIMWYERWGYGKLPICIAKTQNSISHDKKRIGAPQGYIFPISEARISAGAGFIVILSGKINTMPGLPKRPAAEEIDISDDGTISGLF